MASTKPGATRIASAVGAQLGRTPVQAPAEKSASAGVSGEERHQLIEKAAYYRAEQRNFEPGYELEDWLNAEAEIERMLSKPGTNASASDA